jgi:hypothetical protein
LKTAFSPISVIAFFKAALDPDMAALAGAARPKEAINPAAWAAPVKVSKAISKMAPAHASEL